MDGQVEYSPPQLMWLWRQGSNLPRSNQGRDKLAATVVRGKIGAMEVDVIRRRDLPHWDVPGAAYFVTTCLEGSIPALGLLDIRWYRSELQSRPRPDTLTVDEWTARKGKLSFARTEEWLDNRSPVRHLSDERLARVVVDAMYFFAGTRYDLLAFVVMPSHIHWVFRAIASWVESLDIGGKVGNWLSQANRIRTPRERVVHTLNRFTALQCNRLLAKQGPFWQHESYDHWIRDAEELERIIRYVEANPVKAGLAKTPEDFPFSSAHDRKTAGLEFGQPLARGSQHKGKR
jgi:type I restriction enzyme R subunit